MKLILIIIGFLILVGGHQLYWLYVGGIFALLANHILTVFHLALSPTTFIVYSLASGILGILMTFFFRKIMIVLTSAIAGSYLSFFIPHVLGCNTAWIAWYTIVAAGIIVASIVYFWYAIPLSIISSLTGATIIIQNMSLANLDTLSFFLILCVFGIITQWILMQYSTPEDILEPGG
jgi:hypothetical protein